MQIENIVAIALLSETAEGIQILTNLRSRDMHARRKIARGDAVHVLLHEIREISIVAWQTLNDRRGYFVLQTFTSYFLTSLNQVVVLRLVCKYRDFSLPCQSNGISIYYSGVCFVKA